MAQLVSSMLMFYGSAEALAQKSVVATDSQKRVTTSKRCALDCHVRVSTPDQPQTRKLSMKDPQLCARSQAAAKCALPPPFFIVKPLCLRPLGKAKAYGRCGFWTDRQLNQLKLTGVRRLRLQSFEKACCPLPLLQNG